MTSGTQIGILEKPPYPMLAKAGSLTALATATRDGYAIEPKLDGIRCMVTIEDAGGEPTIQLFNRQRTNITARFPDVVEYIRASMTTRSVGHTFDGEIYIRGPLGEPDFQLVQTRANRVRDVMAMAVRYPARFAAFDMLRQAGRDITNWSLASRRHAIFQTAPMLGIATYTQEEADDIARRQAGEGLMLKLWSSKYRPGTRDPSWLKVKWLRDVECLVGGVTYGIGKRESSFGGLLVGVYRPQDAHGVARLTYIGTVGTGFTDAVLADLTRHLKQIRTADCPFMDRNSDWDLAYFVRPVMRVKVAFSEYTRDGIMRFPRFVAVL